MWIIACLEGVGVHGVPTYWSGSSIYPAVQNMLLAARALGLGATLTTLFLRYEQEVAAALGLPEGVSNAVRCCRSAIRSGRFGPVRRIPLSEVVYRDRWGPALRRGAEAAGNGRSRFLPALGTAPSVRFSPLATQAGAPYFERMEDGAAPLAAGWIVRRRRIRL